MLCATIETLPAGSAHSRMDKPRAASRRFVRQS